MKSLDKLKERINSSPYLKEKALAPIYMQYIKEAEKESEDYQKRSKSWSVEDFISRAKDLEAENWELVYNKELFEENLYSMIEKHDATIGINWDVIDMYLDNCKK